MNNLIIDFSHTFLILLVLSAGGLFFSAFLESPTAIFCSTSITLLILVTSATSRLGQSMHAGHDHSHGHAHEVARLEQILSSLAERLATVLEPITNSEINSSFSSGLSLFWSRDLLPVSCAGSGIVFLLWGVSTLVLKRRELELIERSSAR